MSGRFAGVFVRHRIRRWWSDCPVDDATTTITIGKWTANYDREYLQVYIDYYTNYFHQKNPSGRGIRYETQPMQYVDSKGLFNIIFLLTCF
jgi:hypothetical protein